MVQLSLTGLDYQTLLSCYGFHEEHGLRNSSNILPLFQDCYKKCLSSQSVINCFKEKLIQKELLVYNGLILYFL